MARSTDAVSVPLRHHTAAIFVDESGSKSTAGGQFSSSLRSRLDIRGGWRARSARYAIGPATAAS